MRDDELYEWLGQTFEWDRLKALRNAIKHGVRFTEAATVFFDHEALFSADGDHSIDEERYTVVGYSLQQRTLFVVHVVRGDKIRIVSARRAEPDERRAYERQLGR
ncbi:BrnT family toxin [Granulicella cerasi]|uniref:BrnT family toxin n=1 Tax=Granulicella cerasi TaxID=741063 RepID=A0ABW1Z6D6_9BACT|nr:BrnT family toxin [Granulicella cerasi]